MDTTRKIELSLYVHLDILLPALVSVVTSYDEKEASLPCVAIDIPRYYDKPLELGNRNGLRKQLIIIDVLADSKQQRDDIGDVVYNALIGSIPIYDFAVNAYPPLPPFLGYLRILDRVSEPIIVFRDLVEKFYWRRKITLNAEYLDT